MLTAYYDLALCPPTYDFVSFLLHVECERIRRQETHCSVEFLPGTVGGFRRDRLWPFSVAEREGLLNNLVMPMCSLLPSCLSAQRSERGALKAPSIGNLDRLYGLGVFVEAMSKTGATLRAPCPVAEKGFVTITLRECEHWPERNSDKEEWIDAAGEIQRSGFKVLFVRDSLQAHTPIGGFRTIPQASTGIVARANLYASAFCNLFVSSGPAWLAIGLGAPCLIFRPINDESNNPAARSSHFFASGIDRGGQVPGALETQRLVWESDDRHSIVAAFERYRGEHAR